MLMPMLIIIIVIQAEKLKHVERWKIRNAGEHDKSCRMSDNGLIIQSVMVKQTACNPVLTAFILKMHFTNKITPVSSCTSQ